MELGVKMKEKSPPYSKEFKDKIAQEAIETGNTTA